MRFWIVDWSSIFHKVRLVRMNPKNEYKIAFNTRLLSVQDDVGLTNAPVTFQYI
jgi:hypothetical protein